MASTFKSYVTPSIGTSANTVYNPTTTGIQSTVIGMTVANRTTAPIAISVQLDKGGTGTNVGYVLKDGIVGVGGAIIVVGGDQKLVIEKDDKLKVSSNSATSADSTISVLEITP